MSKILGVKFWKSKVQASQPRREEDHLLHRPELDSLDVPQDAGRSPLANLECYTRRSNTRAKLTGFFSGFSSSGSFPLRGFPLHSFPLSGFPFGSFPLCGFPLHSFPFCGFPLHGFPLSGFPLHGFSLRGFLSGLPLRSFSFSSHNVYS